MIYIRDVFSLGSKMIGDSNEYYPARGGGLFPILSVVLRNIYVISAIILFFFIFIGGLGMVLNAGNPEKLKQSSQTTTSAVTGFLILFCSYWLIKLIERVLGIPILELF